MPRDKHLLLNDNACPTNRTGVLFPSIPPNPTLLGYQDEQNNTWLILVTKAKPFPNPYRPQPRLPCASFRNFLLRVVVPRIAVPLRYALYRLSPLDSFATAATFPEVRC